MPGPLCVFPLKDGQAAKYFEASKSDLLDANNEPDTAFYLFDDEDGAFVRNYQSTLDAAGFKDGVREDDDARCIIKVSSGEGEVEVRMRYEYK